MKIKFKVKVTNPREFQSEGVYLVYTKSFEEEFTDSYIKEALKGDPYFPNGYKNMKEFIYNFWLEEMLELDCKWFEIIQYEEE